MEESMSTSASSVRTLYQGHNSTENMSQIRREREQQAPPFGGHVASSTDVITGISANTGFLERPVAGPSNGGTVSVSAPSSPHVNALVLPSAPDSPGPSPLASPSIDSVSESSLPSVSSSFFFSSSAPGSPGRSHPGSYPSSHPHSDHEHDHEPDLGRHLHARTNEQGLIIPSLTLPNAPRRPTPFGQTLGKLKVLVLGSQGAGKSFLTGLLLEDNEDVVDVGTWEDWHGGEEGAYAYGKVLRASTDWAEQHDVFGLDRYEPMKNVEIVELPGYSHDADINELITRLKAIIEIPFRALHDLLHPDTQPSATVANMLATPSSPLYTATVFLLPSPPTSLDKEIISALSAYTPLIVLPRLHGPHRTLGSSSSAKLSAFRPASAVALRSGLFHSPETVALLREEAVDRFLRWREVEIAIDRIWEGSQRARQGQSSASGGRARRKLGEKEWGRVQRRSVDYEGKDGETHGPKAEKWSKAKWEAEWMESHSQDVAMRMREGTITERNVRRRHPVPASPEPEDEQTNDLGPDIMNTQRPPQEAQDARREYVHTTFDPLHLPSLLIFSASLLGPLRARVSESVRGVVGSLGETQVQVALFGGFCIGLSLGVWAKVW